MATKSKSKVKEEQGEAAVQPVEAERTDTVSGETAETSAPQGTEATEPAVPEPVTPEPAAPGADVKIGRAHV